MKVPSVRAVFTVNGSCHWLTQLVFWPALKMRGAAVRVVRTAAITVNINIR